MSYPNVPLYATRMAKGIPGQLLHYGENVVRTRVCTDNAVAYGAPLFIENGAETAVTAAKTATNKFDGIAIKDLFEEGHYPAHQAISSLAVGTIYVTAGGNVEANAPVAVLDSKFVAVGTEASATYNPSDQVIEHWEKGKNYPLTTVKYSTKHPIVTSVIAAGQSPETLTEGTKYNIVRDESSASGWSIVFLDAVTATGDKAITIKYTASKAKEMAYPIPAKFLENANADGIVAISVSNR